MENLSELVTDTALHITSGDSAGKCLAASGLPVELLVWHDILYNGPRSPGWPEEDTLVARAKYLERATASGLDKMHILDTLRTQYGKLADAVPSRQVVLWFDACLFDQSMLAHLLTCLRYKRMQKVELICVDSFPGIEPFHGLGQLQPKQLASLFGGRLPVSEDQFEFAAVVDRAFAEQDPALFSELEDMSEAPLPWVPAAVTRWREEQPDFDTGLGRLEALALAAIRNGCGTPGKIFASVAAADTPPQFWGDTTLWAKINGLADRNPPLVEIHGPADRLPQWDSELSLEEFMITATCGA